MPAIIEDTGAVNKANYARYLGPILRGIALIVASWAFIVDVPSWCAGKWGTALPVFALASFALIATQPNSPLLPAIEGERTARQQVPWSLLAYLVITGLGYNWVCAFLWFSRRYALLSGPVVGTVALISALCAVIGVVVGLTTRNWRTALAVSVAALCLPSITVLRLRLLR